MTNKQQFVSYLDLYKDRMDFIHYMGGAGGEWLACTISNLSDDYQDISMDNHPVSSLNRWQYTTGVIDPFFGFWLSLSKKTKADLTISYETLDKLGDEFIDMYSIEKQERMLNNIPKAFENNRRVLIRSHSQFKGFEQVFDVNVIRNISILPEDTKWYLYIKLLVAIKITSIPYNINTKELKDFIDSSWELANRTRDNVIDKDVYYKRLDHVLSSQNVVYSHSIIGLLDAHALGYKGDYAKVTQEVLNTDPIEFNTLHYFWNHTPSGYDMLVKYTDELELFYYFNRSKVYMDLVKGNCDQTLGMRDILDTNKIPTIFNIDSDKYLYKMKEWHNKNMKLIYELEDYLGLILIDETQLLKDNM